MSEEIFLSKNAEDTAALAGRLALEIKGTETILLDGGLGAGKTTFVKALAKALGVKDTVTSPTFTFMKEYEGRVTLYHFDLYRAETEEEVSELGLREFIGRGVSAIEWNKFANLPGEIIEIEIKRLDGDNRSIIVKRR